MKKTIKCLFALSIAGLLAACTGKGGIKTDFYSARSEAKAIEERIEYGLLDGSFSAMMTSDYEEVFKDYETNTKKQESSFSYTVGEKIFVHLTYKCDEKCESTVPTNAYENKEDYEYWYVYDYQVGLTVYYQNNITKEKTYTLLEENTYFVSAYQNMIMNEQSFEFVGLPLTFETCVGFTLLEAGCSHSDVIGEGFMFGGDVSAISNLDAEDEYENVISSEYKVNFDKDDLYFNIKFGIEDDGSYETTGTMTYEDDFKGGKFTAGSFERVKTGTYHYDDTTSYDYSENLKQTASMTYGGSETLPDFSEFVED